MSSLTAWIEIAASFAVLVTLIFLNIQIRQSNVLIRSEARQAQVINDQEHIYKFIEHPDIATSYTKPEKLTDDERTRLNFWIIASMRARENENFQYKHGALDEVTWVSYRQVIPFTLGTRRARSYWEACSPFFDPDFVKMVNEMIADQPETDYWDAIAAID